MVKNRKTVKKPVTQDFEREFSLMYDSPTSQKTLLESVQVEAEHFREGNDALLRHLEREHGGCISLPTN